jgi:hypothetical protein
VGKFHDPIVISSDDSDDEEVISSDDSDDEEVILPYSHRHRGPCKINFMWDWKKEVTKAVADLDRKQTLVSYFVISN